MDSLSNDAYATMLNTYRNSIEDKYLPPIVAGHLTRVVGLTLEAKGCRAPVGGRCLVGNLSSHQGMEAEVVGFDEEKLYLMPIDRMQGVEPGEKVLPMSGIYKVQVGDNILGRVLDGRGNPLDRKGKLLTDQEIPLYGEEINPLRRARIDTPLDVGIRSINSLLSVGRGQRIGLFAGSGVGKSVLLGMMTRFTEAEVVVVGLIGERGREVKDFIENILGEEGLKRAVVIAVPADQTPIMRLHGPALATSIAEFFAAQGKNVLLLIDSLTRYAQAQREIGLAIGEPPTTKGYPPSVFAKLPALVERAGNGINGSGSITAFYTVLTEGDDQQDPIADSARAILDGHIVLSRYYAEMGHYPAIDVEASISRVMTDITNAQQQQMAKRFRRLLSVYQQNKDLISVGAYTQGSDAAIDEAIMMFPRLLHFLQQGINEAVDLPQSIQDLEVIMRAKS